METSEKIVGNVFGKLLVIDFLGYKKNKSGRNIPMVKCECECGKEKIISLWDLKTGKTKTCGYNHPHYEDRSIPAFNSIYRNSYKKRAIAKGLAFELTEEQFKEISQLPCHYCGSLSTNTHNRGVIRTGKGTSQYLYNGIDRLDNSKGYTIDNCVPCCKICNHSKHTMSYDEFMAWIDKIISFRTHTNS